MAKSKNPKNKGKIIANLGTLAVSGLLPTPTTGSNRNSRNAVRKIGDAHQNHGLALGLAQVVQIAAGILPKEFNSWGEVPPYYARFLPTPLVSDATVGAVIGKHDRFRMTKGLPRKVNRNGSDGSHGLARLVHFLPTPNAAMTKTCGMSRESWEKRIKDGRQEDLNMSIYRITGKTFQLNPLFVGEMMGFPKHWTASAFQNGEPKA